MNRKDGVLKVQLPNGPAVRAVEQWQDTENSVDPPLSEDFSSYHATMDANILPSQSIT